MKNYPGICVVIPVYNCEKYLDEAIHSVLNQPHAHISIVLVDDGSSDSSPEICDRYALQHDRIHAIHQKNSGVSAARNAGIEYVLSHHPDAAYIAFLDADDKWHKDFFTEEILNVLKCGYDLLGFQSCNCNSRATRRTQPQNMEEGSYLGGVGSVWKHSSQHFAAMLYATNLIRDYHIRFQCGVKYSEDVIFRMQCIYLAEDMLLNNRLMHLYRHSATSAVHSRKYGISYYEPIVDAWIASDQMMNDYQNERRAALWEGRAMAAVCLVDMVEEHYQHFGSKYELEQLFQRKPEYLELITGAFACNHPGSGLRWQAITTHPVKFRVKCCVRGITRSVARGAYLSLMKIPLIAAYLDKIRYPIGL